MEWRKTLINRTTYTKYPWQLADSKLKIYESDKFERKQLHTIK